MTLARRLLQATALLAAASLLSGCNLVVFNPAGDIAARQGQLIVVATVLYGFAAHLLGAPEPAELRQVARKRRQ